MTQRLVVALVLVVSGCGKGDKSESGAGEREEAAAACDGPLRVTVDDQPLTLGHGLAVTQVRSSSDVALVVSLFNQPGATCEQLLASSGRASPAGEVTVRATTGKGLLQQAVGIMQHTQMSIDTKLVGPEPTKVGDPVSICVPPSQFRPRSGGEFEGKAVAVSGTFTGTYCGVQTL